MVNQRHSVDEGITARMLRLFHYQYLLLLLHSSHDLTWPAYIYRAKYFIIVETTVHCILLVYPMVTQS